MAISAFDHKPMSIRIDKSFIEDEGENRMNELPFAMREGRSCCTCRVLFLVEVLNGIG